MSFRKDSTYEVTYVLLQPFLLDFHGPGLYPDDAGFLVCQVGI